MKPPIAKRVDQPVETHGDLRNDEYAWLRDREGDADVLAYLEAENAYAEALTEHTKGLRKTLYDEMLGRIQEDDVGVPYRRGPWWYFRRTEKGKAYSIWCRVPAVDDEPPRPGEGPLHGEQLLLDENALAEGHEYHALGLLAVSPDHSLIAYGSNHDGNEKFRLKVRDIGSGEDVDEVNSDVYYGVAWANDNATLYYTTLDSAHRPWQLHRHRIGRQADELVWQEDDEMLFVHLSRMRSGAYVLLSLDSHTTSELVVFDANDPQATPRVIAPRRAGVEVGVAHRGDRFYFCTNHEAVNFRVMEGSVDAAGPEEWTEFIAHDADVHILGVDAFQDFLVVNERIRGVPVLVVWDMNTGDVRPVMFEEPSYSLSPGPNIDYLATTYRFDYESPITPPTVFDEDMATGARKTRKVQPVLGGFDPSEYVVERVEAAAPDGVMVPATLVRRRDTPTDGTAPGWLRGYGSYGHCNDARFSSSLLSLLDRGFVCGVAHIRGGGDLGRQWYLDGKLGRKTNTFTDFIAVADGLISTGQVAPDKLCIYGGSAGGMLMGAVANLRPGLFHVVVADVPFVDCLNTILDPTLPLTVIEWEEWGNPVADAEVYAYMKSYSPYENVGERSYPHILALAGLNDPRVSYWEPAKWVSRLRVLKTDTKDLVLKTNMGAGHGGKSGRYGRLDDLSWIYGFVLDRV
jgi:oligopeptidase B